MPVNDKTAVELALDLLERVIDREARREELIQSIAKEGNTNTTDIAVIQNKLESIQFWVRTIAGALATGVVGFIIKLLYDTV